MKRIIQTLLAIIIAIPGISQEGNIEKLENLENNTPMKSTSEVKVRTDSSNRQDTVLFEVGDEIFSIKELGDETRIKLGKKEYRIVENNDGVVVFKSSSKDNNNNNSGRRNNNRFKGHLGGLEFGFNDFLTEFWSTSLNPEDNYFDINTAKSNNWNFLLPCLSIGFTRHLGIATTIGLNFNKYRFDGNNSITKDENGVIGPSYPEAGIVYSKSKLATTYATLPIILEGQIPLANSRRTINMGAGIIGAVKLGSHTKVIYYNNGKQKEKRKDDFSLNTLRWGATARLGYEFFQVYGTCYFTSMFEKGKGPELYPFEVGIAFTFND